MKNENELKKELIDEAKLADVVGGVAVTDEDLTRLPALPSGSRVEKKEDGTLIVYFPNGGRMTCDPRGSTSVEC